LFFPEVIRYYFNETSLLAEGIRNNPDPPPKAIIFISDALYYYIKQIIYIPY
jgi:hypothetical protein